MYSYAHRHEVCANGNERVGTRPRGTNASDIGHDRAEVARGHPAVLCPAGTSTSHFAHAALARPCAQLRELHPPIFASLTKTCALLLTRTCRYSAALRSRSSVLWRALCASLAGLPGAERTRPAACGRASRDFAGSTTRQKKIKTLLRDRATAHRLAPGRTLVRPRAAERCSQSRARGSDPDLLILRSSGGAEQRQHLAALSIPVFRLFHGDFEQHELWILHPVGYPG
jgi:hypothetical protein